MGRRKFFKNSWNFALIITIMRLAVIKVFLSVCDHKADLIRFSMSALTLEIFKGAIFPLTQIAIVTQRSVIWPSKFLRNSSFQFCNSAIS